VKRFHLIENSKLVLGSLKDMDRAQSELDVLNEMLNAVDPHDKKVYG
jgi:hypothetical protein